MKLFILTTDLQSLENSDQGDCEAIMHRDGDQIVCDFETFPDRLIKTDFNPINGLVTLTFHLKQNEILAVGNKNAKRTIKK